MNLPRKTPHCVSISVCLLFTYALVISTIAPLVPRARAQLSALIGLCDLISRVVGVAGNSVNALVPVQLVHPVQPSQYILGELPSPSAFVTNSSDFATSATATSVSALVRDWWRELCKRHRLHEQHFVSRIWDKTDGLCERQNAVVAV